MHTFNYKEFAIKYTVQKFGYFKYVTLIIEFYFNNFFCVTSILK